MLLPLPGAVFYPSTLDTFTEAINGSLAIWSFRKLYSSYSGNCIQLSDGSNHTDIGWLPADSNGDIWFDGYAAAEAIAEGKTGIRTWYDQKENADLTQRTFSTSLYLDLDATPSRTPAIYFPLSGTNALHDDTNDGTLTDFFSYGGTIYFNGKFDSSAVDNKSAIYSKGEFNYLHYEDANTLELNSEKTVDSRFTYTEDSNNVVGLQNWFSTVIRYNETGIGTPPTILFNDNPQTTMTIDSVGSGSKVSDASNKFSIGNKPTTIPNSGMSGYISEFIIWDEFI
jgi:hypothetical protein